MSFSYKKHDAFPNAILIRDFIEEVNVKEIISSWEYLLSNHMLEGSIKGVINNLIGCRLQINMESFNTLISYLKKNEILRKLKLAVICDNPQFIIFPLLGEMEEKQLQIRVFSTETAAVNWIMFG